MSARRQRVGVLALVAALGTALGGPGPGAHAADAAREAPTATTLGTSGASTARPTTPPDKARPDAEREPLTPEQVQAQVEQAQKLQRELAAADKQIAAATAELGELSARSGAAMDAVATARKAEAAARKREQQQLARLKVLTKEAAAAKRDVADMAYDAYVNGSSALRDVAAVVELTQGTQAGQDAQLVEYLAATRAADGRRYTALAAAQRQTAQAAITARKQREAATAEAEAAQRKVAQAVAKQQAALLRLQRMSSDRRAELDKVGVGATGLSGVDLSALTKMTKTPLCTEDNGGYANGMFPATALCPVAGYPGHMMRPAAARALAAMSAAYEKDTGSPLCVTDTYRSYAAQVDVKSRKPTLAATPGTSNHGLGLATDLCGGIESFGTPQHRWLQQHAPLFGFFHPAWAQAGKSKPEPWHWEFAQ